MNNENEISNFCVTIFGSDVSKSTDETEEKKMKIRLHRDSLHRLVPHSHLKKYKIEGSEKEKLLKTIEAVLEFIKTKSTATRK